VTLTPQTLLEISIAQLKTLEAFLAEEMVGARDRDDTPEARACREILTCIGVLVPKLQAARYVMPREALEGRCESCEEG